MHTIRKSEIKRAVEGAAAAGIMHPTVTIDRATGIITVTGSVEAPAGNGQAAGAEAPAAAAAKRQRRPV
jgi:hypothetical protein